MSLLKIICFCAVDCYALISGYVMCESKVKISNLINLWFRVIFYSVAITIGMKNVFQNSVSTGTIFYSFFSTTIWLLLVF